ncbi:response regulator [Corallococcus sp. bb12-1]|uniref:response regulator n=1 Tax=Corallococcus sp. bb12-1 TaxID=2996784 RepID=UPI00226FBD31|nr:response regulator [Corallococcus sp. bb12-1]MCY1045987.1 response regulator [Corallococcus sp. bb12-1]
MNPSERLLKQFRDLVTVRLERINRSLMELEAGGSLEAGQRVLRELHGLKGEARMMGFDEINTLVHQMEELVRCAEPHRYRLSSESTDALLTTADTVLALSGALQAGEPPLSVETLVATLQQRTTVEAARPVVPRSMEDGGWAAAARAPGVAPRAEGTQGAASHLQATTRAESGGPVVPAHWSTVALRSESAPAPSMSPVAAASHLLMTAIRSEPPGGQTALGTGQGSSVGAHPGASASGTSVGWSSPGPVPGASVGAHPASSFAGASAGSPLAGPAPGASAGSHFVGHSTGASAGSYLVGSTPGASAGPSFVNPAAAPLPGTRLIDTAAGPRPPPVGALKTGGGAARNGEMRVDTAVRIGVASLDMLTSAVTNLGQVARRRELANARRLALVRELSELARAAEDLGPAGVALAERLGRAKELAATLHREAKLLANAELRDLGQVSEEVQTLRMLPLAVLFEPYPRMVRDLARELGKEVELVVDGEDTRADRSVVEALREPLMHLVRNALDHGLETRVDRVGAGKHPRGCLTLRAAREGSRIVLRVEDDGMGMDPALLRRVAVRRGVLDEATANALSDAAARDLIFLPGFSSREVVTDLSGRGVGLDAVRASLQALGGDVGVESAPGWGTIFTLRVPVSLTVAPLLFIQVGDETLALGAVHVSRAIKVEATEVGEVAGRPVLRAEGRVLPFASLASLLGHAAERPAREGELVLVVKGQGMEAALAVDRVLEERVQAILPLKGILARFTHLTGATSLADGRLAMVLSAATLAAGVHGTAPLRLVRPPLRTPEVRRRRILVVDDSPLTRELVANLLEAVGYDTLRAPDGVGALALLGEDGPPVELVVTDLEMPRMDGVELTRRLKTDPARNALPVVILTTRGGEADRARGLAAGADGYITKGDLVRQDLVDVVGRLLA